MRVSCLVTYGVDIGWIDRGGEKKDRVREEKGRGKLKYVGNNEDIST